MAHANLIESGGALGGSLAIEAFVRTRPNIRVVVQSNDAPILRYGSKNAKKIIHLNYSVADEIHYRLLDKYLEPLPIETSPANCLFDAFSAALKKPRSKIRSEVSSTLKKHPMSSCRKGDYMIFFVVMREFAVCAFSRPYLRPQRS